MSGVNVSQRLDCSMDFLLFLLHLGLVLVQGNFPLMADVFQVSGWGSILRETLNVIIEFLKFICKGFLLAFWDFLYEFTLGWYLTSPIWQTALFFFLYEFAQIAALVSLFLLNLCIFSLVLVCNLHKFISGLWIFLLVYFQLLLQFNLSLRSLCLFVR